MSDAIITIGARACAANAAHPALQGRIERKPQIVRDARHEHGAVGARIENEMIRPLVVQGD
ncbi:MAG: hypothetical protein WDM79_09675 [Terricaulis sp.]